MSCCEHCCGAEGDYDDGYEAGRAEAKREQSDLADWAFKNRHNLTSVEYDLLERVDDLMKRGERL